MFLHRSTKWSPPANWNPQQWRHLMQLGNVTNETVMIIVQDLGISAIFFGVDDSSQLVINLNPILRSIKSSESSVENVMVPDRFKYAVYSSLSASELLLNSSSLLAHRYYDLTLEYKDQTPADFKRMKQLYHPVILCRLGLYRQSLSALNMGMGSWNNVPVDISRFRLSVLALNTFLWKITKRSSHVIRHLRCCLNRRRSARDSNIQSLSRI